MSLKAEYLRSLYQTERIIKKTTETSIEVVKNTQSGDLFIKKVVADKSLGEVYHILKNIDHTHIVKVINCFELETSLIVIEEYIQGQNLKERLKMPVEEMTAINWIEQLCSALEFMHNQSPPIIHRDLKPSNIMLSRGQIVLIDFDIARSIKQDANSDTTLIGTSGYAPPEQYGFAQTDTRSDIYSLGILFRECLQGKQTKWEPIIKKCIAIDPANRYQTVRDVLSAIKRKERPVSRVALIIVAALLIGASGLAIWIFALPESNTKISGIIEESAIHEPAATNPIATADDNNSTTENNQQDISVKVGEEEISDVKQDSIKKETPANQQGPLPYSAKYIDKLTGKEMTIWSTAPFDAARIKELEEKDFNAFEEERKKFQQGHELFYPQFEEVVRLYEQIDDIINDVKMGKISPNEGVIRIENIKPDIKSGIATMKETVYSNPTKYQSEQKTLVRDWSDLLRDYVRFTLDKRIRLLKEGKYDGNTINYTMMKFNADRNKIMERYAKLQQKFNVP